MLKKVLLTVIGLLLVVGIIVGIYVIQIKSLIDSGKNFVLPPEMITSSEISEQSWQQKLNAIASLTAHQGVQVSSEVAGKVEVIHFESGQNVEEGQLLVELDASTEEAQLSAALADARLAEINFVRAKKLRATNTVAEAELDAAEASSLSAAAQVANLKALIEKKKITAPFSGRLGIRQVDLGQFINSGNAIASLQALDPIYVDFSLPQKQLSLIEEGMRVEVSVDAYEASIFSGTISAINPEIDVSTRSIGVRASLDNSAGKLLPGMFAKVSVLLPLSEPLKVVPATAILYASFGDSIYVINEQDGKKTVQQHFVRVIETRGDFVAIATDLEPGTPIASTGVFKLRNNMWVETNNALAPKAELNPTPADS